MIKRKVKTKRFELGHKDIGGIEVVGKKGEIQRI